MKIITYLIYILSLIQSFEILPKEYIDLNNTIFIWGTLFLFIVFFIFNLFYNYRYDKFVLTSIILLIISLFLSYLNNKFQHGALALFIIFFGYFFFFIGQSRFKYGYFIHYSFFTLGLIYCVLPVFLHLFFQTQSLLSPYDNTFKGFATHRNSYGYMAGILILIILIKEIKYLYVFIPPLIIGLILSQSRSSLIATFVSLMYVKISNSNRKKLLISISIIISLVIYFLFSIYSTRNNDEGDIGRLILVNDYIDFISKNPIWGYGGDYQIEYYNKFVSEFEIFPAHNTILQVWASFGIIVLCFFINVLYQYLKRKGLVARSIWIYLIFLGMFQPTLSLGVGTLFCLISILANYYDNFQHKINFY